MKTEDALIKLLQSQFILKIDDAYGDSGVNDFKCFLDFLKTLYKNVSPSCYATITAFMGYSAALTGKGKEMRIENVHSVGVSDLIVRFLDDESVVLYQKDEIDAAMLSSYTFVYHWRAGEANPDQFYIKGVLQPFSDDVTPAEGSFFAVRTYSDLDEALINYRDNHAVMCKGRPLVESMTPTRLFFNSAPESLLQEALNDYLSDRLRNCDVKREHIVDESHPVDIICKWRGTNHIALIEIKWIGTSLNSEGKISTTYNDSRANKGASQLVDYIDANTDTFPRDVTMGYLVVFDLRRRNNNDAAKTKLSRADANYYKDREIKYKPQHELTRQDFRKPYRFFIKVSNEVYED